MNKGIKIILWVIWWFLVLLVVIAAIETSKYDKSICRLKDKKLIQSLVYDSTRESHGSFLLFVGTYSSTKEQYYMFFEQLQSGYILKKASAQQVVIVESNEAPHIRYYTNYECKTELYVPYNTIIKKYEIDIGKGLY